MNDDVSDDLVAALRRRIKNLLALLVATESNLRKPRDKEDAAFLKRLSKRVEAELEATRE